MGLTSPPPLKFIPFTLSLQLHDFIGPRPYRDSDYCIPNSCKALLKNTLYIREMYKGIKLRIRKKWHEIKLVQNSCENFSMSITDHLSWFKIVVKISPCP